MMKVSKVILALDVNVKDYRLEANIFRGLSEIPDEKKLTSTTFSVMT